MEYQMRIDLTGQDYVEYNYFHTLHSANGKRSLNNTRFLLWFIFAVAAVMILVNTGVSVFSLVMILLLAVFIAVYSAMLKKFIRKNLSAQLERLGEDGKPPYSPVTMLVFAENKLTATGEGKRTELWYSALERVCLYEDRYLFLYESSLSAMIVPVSQVQAQVDYPAFLLFLEQKCGKIERY